MEKIKDHIARQLVGNVYHFRCDCSFPMDVVGEVKDVTVLDDEFIYKVMVGSKLISIGTNHPGLMIEKVC